MVLLSGLTAPGAELVATGRSLATIALSDDTPEEPFGVNTPRFGAPDGVFAVMTPAPDTEVVVPSGLTTPSEPLLAIGNTPGASWVEGLVFSAVAIWEELAFVAEETLVL
jgi:hypothetical protein